MNHYNELRKRAAAKNINTFGDIERTIGMDMEDLTGDPEGNELSSQQLYWCNGATMALEALAEEGLI